MTVKEARSSLVFVIENLVNEELITVRAQRMVPYSATKRNSNASEQLRVQAIHYESTYHLVDKIIRIRKHKGRSEIDIK